MTEKEQLVYEKIIEYYKENKYMPSIRELQKELNYKSPNSIYKIMKILENKNYLTRDNKKKKLIIRNNLNLFQNNIVNVSIINTKEVITINLNSNKKYIGYKIKHDYFNYRYIKKNDYLIIEKTNKLTNEDLGLFVINKKYRIMEYKYQDGFYILKDKDTELLYRVKIIGKVICVYRKEI